MKNKMVLTLILFITLLIVCCTNKNKNEIKFNYFINKNNIIIYNSQIDKDDIDEFKLFYKDKINSFYIKNNLTGRDIEKEKIVILLCINNFGEWTNSIKSKAKIKNKLKLKEYIKIFDDDNIKNYKISATYLFDTKLPAIIIKTQNNSFFKFFFLLTEYNHHLIQTNRILKKIDIDFEEERKFNFIIEEGFTNYFGFYLRNFLQKNKGKFIYDNFIELEEKNAKLIFNYLKDEIKEKTDLSNFSIFKIIFSLSFNVISIKENPFILNSLFFILG